MHRRTQIFAAVSISVAVIVFLAVFFSVRRDGSNPGDIPVGDPNSASPVGSVSPAPSVGETPTTSRPPTSRASSTRTRSTTKTTTSSTTTSTTTTTTTTTTSTTPTRATTKTTASRATSTRFQQTGSGCGYPVRSCDFGDDFSIIDSTQWRKSDNTANGKAFGSWWDARQVSIQKEQLKLSLVREHNLEKPFASGELQSLIWFPYGCFEARMQPAGREGLVSAFFIYTGRYDAAPGAPKLHNEIDFEFIWRPRVNRTIVQTNYFSPGRKQSNEYIIPKFSVSGAMHTYSFKWTRRGILWYIDGQLVRKVTDGTTPTVEDGGAMKMFFNFWSISDESPGAQNWAGQYVHDDGAESPTTLVEWVRFTKGEDCSVS